MGMAVEGGKGRKGVRPEINITPLVDVVLVLLIIFMVVTPQLEAGEHVELPVATNPDPKVKSKLDPVTITYTLSGRLLLEKEQLDEQVLFDRLRAIHAATPDRRILLKGDKALTFGKMRALFQACKGIGFQGVSLVVSEKSSRGGDSLWPSTSAPRRRDRRHPSTSRRWSTWCWCSSSSSWSSRRCSPGNSGSACPRARRPPRPRLPPATPPSCSRSRPRGS